MSFLPKNQHWFLKVCKSCTHIKHSYLCLFNILLHLMHCLCLKNINYTLMQCLPYNMMHCLCLKNINYTLMQCLPYNMMHCLCLKNINYTLMQCLPYNMMHCLCLKNINYTLKQCLPYNKRQFPHGLHISINIIWNIHTCKCTHTWLKTTTLPLKNKNLSWPFHVVSVLLFLVLPQSNIVINDLCAVQCSALEKKKGGGFFVCVMMMMMSWCLMSSDVIWHIRDKLWPMPKHGSIILYVHGNQKAL